MIPASVPSSTRSSVPGQFLAGLARPAAAALAGAVVVGLAGGILAAVQARLMAGVIARVFTSGQSLAQNTLPLRLLLAAILLRSLCIFASEMSAHAAAWQIKSRLRIQIANRLVNPIRLRSERTGELAVVLDEGVEALDAYFSQLLPQAALAALVPLAILAFVFPLDGLSGWVLAITGPLIPLFLTLIGQAAERQTRRQWNALSRLGAHFYDAIQGLATLKLLGRSRQEADAIAASGERYRLASMDVLRITFLSALALEWLATISTAILAVQIGLRLLSGGLTLEQGLAVLILAPEFYQPLRNLGLRFHAAQAGLSAASRIAGILADYPLEAARAQYRAGAKSLQAGFHAITFHQVSWIFPGSSTATINEVSFCLLPGSRSVLAGSSGAGKTTILNLLLGFIQPTSGEIRVGGIPLAELDPEGWRGQCAWVPEKPYIFNDTIAGNIRLGNPGASIQEVEQAAEQAGLAAWVNSLPEKYETRTGEQGARLSAGQAQRLALARAFLRNAPVILLDEPASSLDPELAAGLAQAIERLSAGRTILTVAHRLSTACQADQVLVIENGRLVESGPPAELALAGGPFSRLLAAGGSQE